MGIARVVLQRLFCRKNRALGLPCAPREAGQMTVEFAVVFPVLIIVAVIAVNALLFFSECAAFDRVARDAVRVCATAPGYGQTADQACAGIQSALTKVMDEENLNVEVSVKGGSVGLATYTATLKFYPTLFGMGLKSQVLGVALPALTHRTSLTVDPYRPGVFL
ncbi:MAG: pilus assembly protein [Raoultibacter sp.]